MWTIFGCSFGAIFALSPVLLSTFAGFCYIDVRVNKPDLALPVGVFISSIWLLAGLAECWRRFSLVRDSMFDTEGASLEGCPE